MTMGEAHLELVRGRINNMMATEELIRIIKQQPCSSGNETLYLGYPLSANAERTITVDALLLSEEKGLVAFIFSKYEDLSSIEEEQGELYFQLINTLTQYKGLRKGKTLAIDPHVISILPSELNKNEDEDYIVATFNTLPSVLQSIPAFNTQYYRVLVESLQKIANIKPRKKRENVKNEGSKGDIIKKIEKEIANLDQWQKKAALEIVDGPQRIRGLAGSGKTIVLALKAAYLHAQYPDWEIVLTYYTRSLWQQYRDLISKFVYEFSRDEPNWDKLHLFHAWGSHSEQGLYSEIAHSIGQSPINYTNAQSKFGRENAFSGICEELNQVLPSSYMPLYDLVLIDEAQDMPAPFFKLAYKCVKAPKRIVWAYDELQNLSSSVMPSIGEMFGTNETGEPLVGLENTPDGPNQDIILPVCYRNPPWVLALAHSLGFGIYRKQLVQHFDTLELWEDIGYKKESGELSFGKQVTLSRKLDATPDYFYNLLKPDDVIKTQVFDNEDAQYDYVARQIQTNIIHDELDPDDILVIFPSVIYAKSQYQKFAKHLARYSISSMLAGVTNERDIFHITGCISCSTIFRAKGNEAPMVYIVNSDYCYDGIELIRLRNTLFTAITRSRAWVRIYGTGASMNGLIAEINKFIQNNYELRFRIPTKKEMKKLRTINRERTASDARKIIEAQKGVRTLLELVSKGELGASQIPELESLLKIAMNEKNNGDEYDESEE